MALLDAVWGNDQQGATPQSVDRRRKLAEMLMAQAGSQEKMTSPWQVAGKLFQGLAGGYMDKKAGDEEAAGQSAQNGSLMQALQGYSGGASPAPAGGSPVASSAPAPAAPDAIKQLISQNVPPELQSYATNLVGKESSYNPSAVSPTGATGLAQFTKGTGKQYGLIDQSGDHRADPVANLHALVQLTNDNRAKLTQALGRPPTDGELALAHQQGADGALSLLSGKSVAPGNMAVNGIDPRTDPRMAAQRIMAYYGGAGGQQGAPAPQQPQGVQVASADPNFAPQMPQGGAPQPVAPPSMNERTGMMPPAQPQQPPQQIAQALQGAPQGGSMDPRVQSIAKMLQNPWTAPQGRALAMQLLGKDPNEAQLTQLKIKEAQGELGMLPDKATGLRLGNTKTQNEIDAQPLNNANTEAQTRNSLASAAKTEAETGQVGKTPAQQDYDRTMQDPGFDAFKTKHERAGAMTQEGALDTTLGKGMGDTFIDMWKQGTQARSQSQGLENLRGLLKQNPGGVSGGLIDYANGLGIPLGKNPDAAVAAKAILAHMIPAQRVPGSGTTSDYDARNFSRALPSLINQPGGNDVIIDTLQAQNDYTAAQGDIAGALASKQIDLPTAIAQIKALPDPYASVKQAHPEMFGGKQTAAPAAKAESFANAPAMGAEMEGYIYQGGDPAQQSSWKKK